jgi:hypothetical protein
MNPNDPSSKPSRAAFPILLMGLLLSLVMAIPSLRLLRLEVFAVVFNAVLLGALASPFVVIYYIARNRVWTAPAITAGVLFCCGHIYLIYVTYTTRPQEFGYLGLVFAPLLEAAVAVPTAIILILLINWQRKRNLK